MTEIRVEALTKTFGALRALDDITLAFPDGRFFGLLGPSGSGKTTLLRAIAGFFRPDGGRVLFGGEPVQDRPVEDREIGMVFQNYALFPNMTVAQNVSFGLDVRRVPRPDRARRVAEALELVRLGDLAGRKPHELSGGQRQRVAMARAIVTRPKVLLLDEPLSALDKSLRVEMQIELRRIQREVGITTIFVTHDQEEALTLSDRIGILNDGRLVREGRPLDVYDDPGDAFTARFLGEANLFRAGEVRAAMPDGRHAALPGGPPDRAEMFAVRPEHLRVTPEAPAEGPALEARLLRKVFAGALGTCVLDWRGHEVKAQDRYAQFADLREGEAVWISWPADSMRWVAAD